MTQKLLFYQALSQVEREPTNAHAISPNNWRITYVLLYPLLGVSVLNRKTFSRLFNRAICIDNNRVFYQKRDEEQFR